MTAPALTRQAIVQKIADLRERERDGQRRRVVAIRGQPFWPDDEEFTADGDAVHVVPCASPLAVRAALVERDSLDTWLVILTELDQHDLGDEVVARLARFRIETVDMWDAVARSFRTTDVDPKLRAVPDLADVLLQHRPATGFPAVPSLILLYDQALDAACRYALQLPDFVDLGGGQLLRWAATPGAGQLWAALPAAVQGVIAEWWSVVAGTAGALVPGILRRGKERDAVALGLAADAVALAGSESAAGFLAAEIGGGMLSVVQLAEFGAAARAAVDDSGYSVQRAEAILEKAGAHDVAIFSDVLPAGFDLRLTALGQELALAQASAGAMPDAEAALGRCRDHQSATQAVERLAAAEHALRLVRFLHGDEAAGPASLAAAAAAYAQSGAWVDRARTVMRRGEGNAALASAYDAIDTAIAARRDTENERFGKLVQNWLAAGSGLEGLVPVERVLVDLVAPLASSGVLLVVLDGASLAIWSELAEGLSDAGWVAAELEDEPRPLVGLATIPSVTAFSRTSLLCGELRKGTQKDEGAAFPVVLKPVSKGRPARLFHKADMSPSKGNVISHDATTTIADPAIPVVGVVINEIDDALGGGSQSHRTWTISSIPPLQACLNAARAANRAVVVTSDHGHVVEYDVAHAHAPKSGERWRPGTETPLPGELRVEGPRVLAPGHAAVVPWTERLRYSTKREAGYHGGLTPQEMLAPLAVLLPAGTKRQGWRTREPATPEWW